jgi:hypothetical protein
MEPAHFTNILLCIVIVMGGITWSIMMYTINQSSNDTEQRGQQTVKSIDTLISYQGNLSSTQRNTLIKTLQDLPSQIQTLNVHNAKIDQSLIEIQDAVQCLQAGNHSTTCSHIPK